MLRFYDVPTFRAFLVSANFSKIASAPEFTLSLWGCFYTPIALGLWESIGHGEAQHGGLRRAQDTSLGTPASNIYGTTSLQSDKWLNGV